MNTFDAFDGILMDVPNFQLVCFLSVWMQALQLQSPTLKWIILIILILHIQLFRCKLLNYANNVRFA